MTVSFSFAEIIQISPKQAVNMALENSLDSENALYKENIKKLYKNNAWNVFVPNVNLSSTLSRNPSALSELERDYWGFGFGVGINLSLSPSVLKRMQLVMLEYESAKIERESAVRNIKLNVLKSYNQLIALKSTLKVFESQIQNSKLKFEQARIAYNNGLISEIDFLDAQLKYKKSQPDLDGHIINFEKSKEIFKLLIGLDHDQDFEIIGELPDETIDFSLFNEALNFNESLEIKDLNMRLKMTEQLINSLWLDTYLPSLSLSFSYSPYKSFHENSKGFSTGFLASFSLNYGLTEIFPFSKSFTKIQDNNYQLKILQNNIEGKIRNLKSSIVQKRKDIRRYKAILDASKINVELANKNYQMAFNAFNSGVMDLSKLNDIELVYKQSDLKFIEDKLNYANSILEYKNLINSLD
ncbi:TolC family protein [Borreliella burgdorferi]|uniref:TolC family protein n=1 Tax=Borreliella burgdorferi TaxID=139 RepID=UPI0026F410AC|nr:TolC family protein [Borreliella burgdorferi]MDO7256537.1 TolC family protein [Borreliella burgdorferi]MDO7279210.1 TolC family protein [Borreliella burgdorferi]